MGHRCSYSERIEFENNQLVRIVNAVYKNMKGTICFSEDVYKEYEDGRIKGRYLAWSNVAGYIVNFPGDKLGYYGGYNTQQKQNFEPYNELNMWINHSTPIPILAIMNKRPELKYLLKKMDSKITCSTFMKIVKQYKKYPNIEELVRMNLYGLALNENLQKLKPKKKSELISYIKQHIYELDNWTSLYKIQRCLKYNCTLKDLEEAAYCRYNFPLHKYLEKIEEDYNYYLDYIKMCKQLGKNLKDPYWRYPKNLTEAHNKMSVEVEKAKKTESKSKVKKLKAITENLVKNNTTIKGYQIIIPNDMQLIKQQAEELHQCLLTAGYDNKMIEQKAILVFIRKDNKPIATAEVFYDKKVGQFYGNERDRANCKPSPEIEKIFYKWLKTAVIKKKKLEGSNIACV